MEGNGLMLYSLIRSSTWGEGDFDSTNAWSCLVAAISNHEDRFLFNI